MMARALFGLLVAVAAPQAALARHLSHGVASHHHHELRVETLETTRRTTKKMRGTAQAPAPAPAGSHPLQNEQWETVPVMHHKRRDEKPLPLSTTMQCVINLTIQYFAIYTALAVVRTLGHIRRGRTPLENVLELATGTVNYAPMLCVLFLAARMRALQITRGEGDPQDWVRDAMQCCAYSILIQMILVLSLAFFTGDLTRGG